MGKVIDYIKWRGDLSFEIDPLNEIDIALLTQLPLLNIQETYKNNELDKGVSIKDLVNSVYSIYKNNQIGLIIPGHISEVLYEMANSIRYKDLIVSDFVKELDTENIVQFCALTVHIDKHLSCVIYSATDDSVVGWKENFMMLYEEEIHAQKKAKEYFEEIGRKYSYMKYIIAGHSKGGNLSTFASVNVNKKLRHKIQNVYCFDSPGFLTSIYSQPGYYDIEDRIKLIIPQCSVVGMLFNHRENRVIVKANSKGLLQHDLTTWEVKYNKFIETDKLDSEAVHVDNVIKGLISQYSIEEQIRLVDSFFAILACEDNKYLINLKTKKKALLQAYLKTNKEDKKILFTIFKTLIKDNIIRNGLISNFLDFDKVNKENIKKVNEI